MKQGKVTIRCRVQRQSLPTNFIGALMQKRLMIPRLCGWVLLTIAIAAPVSAHHSFAGYDMKKTVSAQATIKEFRWGAPHSSAVFTIKAQDGKLDQITIGSAPPTSYVKQGFKPKDFRVGDKVEIVWHPTRAGNPGGLLAMIKLSDGRVYEEAEYAATLSNDGAQTPQPAAPAPAK